MSDVARQELTIRRGNRWDAQAVVFEYEDPDGQPIDLTGAQIDIYIRRGEFGATVAHLSTTDSTVDKDDVAGQFWPEFDIVDVNLLTQSRYFYLVRITPGGGDPVDQLEGPIVMKGQA